MHMPLSKGGYILEQGFSVRTFLLKSAEAGFILLFILLYFDFYFSSQTFIKCLQYVRHCYALGIEQWENTDKVYSIMKLNFSCFFIQPIPSWLG